MNNFEPIIKNVLRLIDLTEEEKKIFISYLRIIHVRRKQFIVQPEFVCKYRSFVAKGAVQAYLIGKDGKEHTLALAIEDWWISDFISYINQEPATLFVEALEDSILIQLGYEKEQALYELIPKFERFFRLSTERGITAFQRRMLWSLSKTAKKRYDELFRRYPEFFQRFPQYIIASYLGMTTQSLSKIRNQKTNVNLH